MTTTSVRQRSHRWMESLLHSRIALWGVFVVVHLGLGAVNLTSPTLPMGDVTLVYRYWMQQAFDANYWVGIDAPWVYPIGAIVPMIAATALGFGLYAGTWLSLVMVVNAAGLAVLTWSRDRARLVAAWWWMAFLILVGPIALGRIDAITVPMAIAGVAVLSTRPRLAAILFTLGAWVKIWPVALLTAAVIALRERRHIVGAAILTSAAVIAVALAFGSGLTVVSFVTEQTGRGLQIEAPISSIWMWQALAGVPDTVVYYDQQILTYQVTGLGAEVAAAVATPILGFGVVAIVVLGVIAVRRGAASSELAAPLAIALVTALVALNKVGSPQFMVWFVAPVILGLLARASGSRVSFRTPATIVLVMAVLTQLVYPYFYDRLLGLDPLILLALTARNVLEFVLLGWAIAQVVRLAREPNGAQAVNHPAKE